MDDSWELAGGLRGAEECVRRFWDNHCARKVKKKRVRPAISSVRSTPGDVVPDLSLVSVIINPPLTVLVAAPVDVEPDQAGKDVERKVGLFSVIDAKKALKLLIKEDASEDSMIFCSELYRQLALTQFKTEVLSKSLERKLGVKVGKAMDEAFKDVGPALRTGTRVSRPYAFHGVSFILDK